MHDSLPNANREGLESGSSYLLFAFISVQPVMYSCLVTKRIWSKLSASCCKQSLRVLGN